MAKVVLEVQDNFISPGVYDNAKFLGLEEFVPQTGKMAGTEAVRWKFEIEEGKVVSGITEKTGARISNKLGRFLCAISGGGLQPGTKPDPEDYIGRIYTVVVEANENNNMNVKSFLLNV